MRRVAVTETSKMKKYLGDFEKYLAENYGVMVEGRMERETVARGREIGEKGFHFFNLGAG